MDGLILVVDVLMFGYFYLVIVSVLVWNDMEELLEDDEIVAVVSVEVEFDDDVLRAGDRIRNESVLDRLDFKLCRVVFGAFVDQMGNKRIVVSLVEPFIGNGIDDMGDSVRHVVLGFGLIK